MKKLLLLAITALFTLGASAQTVKEIFARYDKVTGLDQSKGTPTLKMDMIVDVVGQGSMPCNIILASEGRMRVNMEIMGMNMTVVSNGKKCWASVPGQGVMEIPAEQAAKITGSLKMGEFTNSMKSYEKFMDFTYEGENDTQYVVKGIVKPGATAELKELAGMLDCTYYFNKETGLIDSSVATVEIQGKTTTVNIKMSDYRKSGLYTIPMLIKTTSDGMKADVKITNVDFEYKPTAKEFEKPA